MGMKHELSHSSVKKHIEHYVKQLVLSLVIQRRHLNAGHYYYTISRNPRALPATEPRPFMSLFHQDDSGAWTIQTEEKAIFPAAILLLSDSWQPPTKSRGFLSEQTF